MFSLPVALLTRLHPPEQLLGFAAGKLFKHVQSSLPLMLFQLFTNAVSVTNDLFLFLSLMYSLVRSPVEPQNPD